MPANKDIITKYVNQNKEATKLKEGTFMNAITGVGS